METATRDGVVRTGESSRNSFEDDGLNSHGRDIGYSTVRQRLRELKSHGLIANVDQTGDFEITEKGPAYLDEELKIDQLETGE